MHRSALLILTLLLALAPARGMAGAWLRDVGDGFLSWTIKIQDGAETTGYSTIYAEYGINPDLTIGLDLGSDEFGDHKALAFVLMPLARDGLHIAFELGAGTLEHGPALRPGLSVGKGLSWGELGGWWNVDTRMRIIPNDTDIAIDATLGLNLWEETKLITQLQQGGPLVDPDFLRLVSSVVWQVAPGHHMEVGLTTALIDAEDFGVKLGMWRSF
ncbi:hypothetical protein ACEWPM_002800 [Roseovarius sp. S4756]|uniref:hypothetical protein n=1 Tax=Roseovarius maritimus TaxID=3342637 RepID=UPI00372A68A6